MFRHTFRAPQITDRGSKVSQRQLASLLPAISNRYPNIRYRSNPLRTNKKTFSNRYYFGQFGPSANLACLPQARLRVLLRP
jgi:hypothetical protein